MTHPQPWIATDGDLTLAHGSQVWTDHHGDVKSIARLGHAKITFHSADQIREVIAYLALLAADHEAEVARHAGDEPVPYWPALGLGGAS